MKIVYLRSTLGDIVWFRTYYGSIFPDGEKRALFQRRATEQLIKDNPNIGLLVREDNIRTFPILRTPFSFVYRHTGKQIEILRIWDARRNPADLVY